LCRPATGDPPHSFTPTLTRQQHARAAPHGFCLECSTQIEPWEGQAGARRYQFAAREVGEALALVARGATYREAAFAARRDGGRLPAVRLTGRAERRDAARDGQLVANWVDVFTEPLCTGLLPEEWPEVVVIDSAELRVKCGQRRGQGFHVIGAVLEPPDQQRLEPPPLARRVSPDSPTKDAAAFERFCDALRGVPRVVITDMDNATRLGVAHAFADQTGALPEMRIGEWHLGRSLRRRIPDGLFADPANPVMQRLGPAFYTPARWQAFIDAVEQEHRARTHGPLSGLLRWIDDHGALIEHQSATRDPRIPNSTSPIEAPLAEIKWRFEDRAGVFTNLARMNKLLALMALDLRGNADGPRLGRPAARAHLPRRRPRRRTAPPRRPQGRRLAHRLARAPLPSSWGNRLNSRTCGGGTDVLSKKHRRRECPVGPVVFAMTISATVFVAISGACDEDDQTQPRAGERARAQLARATAEPDAVVGCRLRAEGPPGLPWFERERDFKAGNATFFGLRSLAQSARRRPGAFFMRRRDGYPAHKVLAGIRAGHRVVVAIAPASRRRAGLIYGARSKRSGPLLRLNETERVVEFRPCPGNEPRFVGTGTVGPRTDFSGGLLVTKAHCLRVQVSSGERAAREYVIAYGLPDGSC
jgi:hypothetical protein